MKNFESLTGLGVSTGRFEQEFNDELQQFIFTDDDLMAICGGGGSPTEHPTTEILTVQ